MILTKTEWSQEAAEIRIEGRVFIGVDITTLFGGFKQSGFGRDKS